VQLAELIENTSKDKDKVKKMSKTNAKSLNAMKQNIKKNNIQYEDEIKKYMEVKRNVVFLYGILRSLIFCDDLGSGSRQQQ
jgi:translation initiation factor 3 subunit C